MAQPYPDPTFSTASGMWQYVDVVLNGWWGGLVMLGFTLVLFMLLEKRGYSTSQSLFISTLLPTIMAILLWSGDLMPGKVMIVWLLFTVLSSVYVIFDT